MAFEITPAPPPRVPQDEFSQFIQWRNAGVDLGDRRVRVVDIVGPGVVATRGVGERSHIITIRKQAAAPPPDPGDCEPETYVLDTFSGGGTLATHTGEVGATWTGEAVSGLYSPPNLALVQLDAGLGAAHSEGAYISQVLVCSGKITTTLDAFCEIVFTMPTVGEFGTAGIEVIESYNSGWQSDRMAFGAFMVDTHELYVYVSRFAGVTLWDSTNINTGLPPGTYTLRLELTEARTRARLLLDGDEVYDSGTVAAVALPTKMGLRLDADIETPTSTYLSKLEAGHHCPPAPSPPPPPPPPPAPCTNLLQDTFTAADGTDLRVHALDVTSAGWAWQGEAWDTFGVQVEVRNNRAMVPVAYNALFHMGYANLVAPDDAPITFDFPYQVVVIGRHSPATLGLGFRTQWVFADETGIDNAFYVELYDEGGAYKARAAVYVYDEATFESTVYQSVVSFGAVDAEHTLSVRVEAHQFTFTVDGIAQPPVICPCHNRFTYAQLVLARGTSYISAVNACDEDCEAPANPLTITRPGMPALHANDSLWRNDIVWNGSVFCAVATGGIANASSVSADGTTWTMHAMPDSSNEWASVAWNGTVFCAVTEGLNNTLAATSPDGITWTARTLPASASWPVVVAHGALLIAFARSGGAITHIATSADNGATWTSRTVPGNTVDINTACSNGTVVVAAGSSADVLTSADGITWTLRAAGMAVSGRYALTWNGTVFCTIAAPPGIGQTQQVSTSADGITWTHRQMLDACGDPIDPTYGYATGMGSDAEGVIVAGNIVGRYSMSADNGMTWYAATEQVLADWPGYSGAMAYDGTKFVVIGQYQRCDHVVTPP